MAKQLQIDVKGPLEGNDSLIECRLYYNGRCCTFYTSKANYKALMHDGLFIRNGKERDSADILNTTNVFIEKL
ncbi:MAG: hypothetical protein EOO88_42540 [Pedobacter sp.]|nr:MAG: hypothetical protein EOO88_42540 [Pedobacter sp.]